MLCGMSRYKKQLKSKEQRAGSCILQVDNRQARRLRGE